MVYNNGCHVESRCDLCPENGVCPTQNAYGQYTFINKGMRRPVDRTKPVFTCPFCGEKYNPILDRKHPEMSIQREFPNAPAWQREQWISGCCTDICWRLALGEDPE